MIRTNIKFCDCRRQVKVQAQADKFNLSPKNYYGCINLIICTYFSVSSIFRMQSGMLILCLASACTVGFVSFLKKILCKIAFYKRLRRFKNLRLLYAICGDIGFRYLRILNFLSKFQFFCFKMSNFGGGGHNRGIKAISD